MVIENSPYNVFVPSTIEINSIGIGLSDHTAVDKLNLTDNEYLVVGERHTTVNELDTKYNFIVNSDGCAINSSRNMFSNVNTNNSCGLYCTNDIVSEGKIIAKGLILEGVTLSDEINPTMLNNLIQSINAKDPLFYTGFSDTSTNNIGNVYLRDNIYTTSFVTIGALTDTFSNSHSLNIVNTAKIL